MPRQKWFALTALFTILFLGILYSLTPNRIAKAQQTIINPQNFNAQDLTTTILENAKCAEERETFVEKVIKEVTAKVQADRSKSHITGYVDSKAGNSFELDTSQETVLVNLSNNTKFLVLNQNLQQEITFSDINQGDYVSVVGVTREDKQGTAKFVVKKNIASVRKQGLMGTIIKIEKNTLTIIPKIQTGRISIIQISPQKGYSNWKINITPQTIIRDQDKNILSPSDVKKCLRAIVEGTTSVDKNRFEVDAETIDVI